jgi:tetratricopeptide (TPR) repeat protein
MKNKCFALFLVFFLFFNPPNLLASSSEETFYHLLISIFLGVNDLDKAEKVAEKAVKRFPKKAEFWEKYGEILIWNNKPQKAVEAYFEAYKLKKSKALAKKILSLAIAYNRFDLAEKLLPDLEYPIKESILVYSQTGNLDSLIKILEKSNDPDTLGFLAQVYVELGEKEKALNILNRIENLYGLKAETVLLKANIYYSQKDFQKALEVLKAFSSYATEKDISFWETLSDLAWMLQDYKYAELASEKLVTLGKGRFEDYDRLIIVYSYLKPQKALEVSLAGYKNFRNPYFLEKAFYIAYSNSFWNEILYIAELLPDKELLLKDPFIFYYTTALQKTGKIEEALKYLEASLKKYFSKDVLSFYIYTLIDTYQFDRLEKVLKAYVTYEKENELINTFAFGYLTLQQGEKALQLFNQAKSPDLILLAEALYTSGKEEESKNLRYKTFLSMKNSLSKTDDLSNLLKNSEFLSNFLSLGIDFLSAEEFEKLLFTYKKYLSKPVFEDIYLSYLLARNHHYKVMFLSRIYKYALKPWMFLNLSLYEYDTYMLKETLDLYLKGLPIRDRVEALQIIGERKKALELAYRGLEDNPYDYQLYKQFRDLIVENKSFFSYSLGYISRFGYSGIKENIELNYKNLVNGWRGGIKGDFLQMLSKDSEDLTKKISYEFFDVYVGKLFDRGALRIGGAYFSALSENFSVYIWGKGLITNQLELNFFAGENYPTDETVFLELGGMKRFLQVSGTYSITNKHFIYGLLELNSYYSQDRKKIGNGKYLYLEWQNKIRTGYPDYTLRFFGSLGDYKEKQDKGKLAELSPYEDLIALPGDFLLLGMGISWGYDHRDSYTRIWRPFFDFNIGYNTDTGLALGSSIGIGGSVFRKDHLSIELNLSKDMQGVEETFFIVGFQYKLFF